MGHGRTMELDFTALSAGVRYKILTALVIPRPIAWVCSLNESGSVNLAPFSFFNVLGNAPPVVGLGMGTRADGSPKDTRRNIEREGEFVINLVDKAVSELMHQTAAPFPAEASEVEALAIATEPSTTLRTPRVSASKVQLECRYEQTVAIGENRIVLGIVQHLHVEDGLLDPTTHHARPGAFKGIGRLQSPGWYSETSTLFDLGPLPPVPNK